MAGFQKVVIVGRLGADPEMYTTKNGDKIATFSVATSKKINGEEVTSWHRVKAFKKTATLIEQYVSKGDNILIEGELSYSSYEKDGITRYVTDVFCFNVVFLGDKNKSNDSTKNNKSNDNQKNNTYQQDDIPF